MPHVEMIGSLSLDVFHREFQPRSFREHDRVTKAQAAFLAHDGRSLLVECLTVEGYLRQSFFVLVTSAAGGIMVRLLPRTSPEKTPGVKRCLVWVARWLAAQDPAARPGTSNLNDHLAIDLPAGALPRLS